MAVTTDRIQDGVDPPYDYPAYASTVYRAPKRPLVTIPEGVSELSEPVYGHQQVDQLDADLTRQHPGEPLGQRIFVSGRVLDSDGRPVRSALSRSGRPTPPGATRTRWTSTRRPSTPTSPAPAAASPTA